MRAPSIDRHNPTQLPAGSPCQTFKLPVDTESKACCLDLLSFARPHMRAFHTSWFAFFLTFLATFAPAALLPVLREDLDLTNTDIRNAGIASVCGAIGSRLLMGTFTDIFGPRFATASVLLGTAPFVFSTALIENAASFVAMRTLVGLSLSMFVVNQYWMTQMFNTKLLGRANALSAGWGNMGGGMTLLLMPLLYEGFAKLLAPHLAWRVAFFIPGVLQLIVGAWVLVGCDDTPTDTFPSLSRNDMHFHVSNRRHAWPAVLSNYRTYILALAYAVSFGVELTTNNVVSLYLYNHFQLSLTASGVLGGALGLMNIGSRFLGGAMSDLAGSHRGMRGRLWVLLAVLLTEGVFCLFVGKSHDSLSATLVMLFLFSFFCQAGCGAVFGIVPFVSKRFTGTVVGVVACGGNVGSAVTQALFFGNSDLPAYQGYYYMGATIITLSVFVALLYWPMWGGMCCPAKPSMTEERYYLAEYSMQERAAGRHLPALGFAHESRSERDGVASRARPAMHPPGRSQSDRSNPSRIDMAPMSLNLPTAHEQNVSCSSHGDVHGSWSKMQPSLDSGASILVTCDGFSASSAGNAPKMASMQQKIGNESLQPPQPWQHVHAAAVLASSAQ